MHRIIVSSAIRYSVLGALFFGSLTSAVARAEGKIPLFKFKDKVYTSEDVSPAIQQTLFDVESERFQKMRQVAESAMLDAHFEQEAKKKGKTKAAVEEAALTVKDPSEKELKDFYEQNKARVPYKYEDVKGEIKNFVVAQQKQKKRQDLIDELRKSGQGTLLLEEPQAPLVSIDTLSYPFKGKKDAKVVIVEFADYQCPHCKAAQPVMSKIADAYKDKIKFVYMDFPINHSGISKIVAEGAQCAAEQDKFWEYHVMAFEKQSELTNDSPVKLAEALKLDKDKFKKCLDSGKAKAQVAKSQEEGNRVGVGGTPTIFINGRRIAGHSEEDLKAAIEKGLKG